LGNKWNVSRKHIANAIRNTSLAQTGKRISEERKRKIGQFHKGKKWYLGRRNTAEARLKISLTSESPVGDAFLDPIIDTLGLGTGICIGP
jgi:hypothetical protein